jgi:Zn-dependent alcohol dehydrogenase
LNQAVREIFPDGVAVTIDTTGVPAIMEACLEAARNQGKFVMVGVPPMGYKFPINAIDHINVGSDMARLKFGRAG